MHGGHGCFPDALMAVGDNSVQNSNLKCYANARCNTTGRRPTLDTWYVPASSVQCSGLHLLRHLLHLGHGLTTRQSYLARLRLSNSGLESNIMQPEFHTYSRVVPTIPMVFTTHHNRQHYCCDAAPDRNGPQNIQLHQRRSCDNFIGLADVHGKGGLAQPMPGCHS